MSCNERLLPPNTKLIWEPASETTEQVTRIKQHDGVFVFNYEASVDPQSASPQYLAPPRVAALACAFVGLTAQQSGDYQGISKNTVKASLTTAYGQLGIKKARSGSRSPQSAHALSRVCELGILELGKPATLTNKLDHSTYATVKWLLRGSSFTEIAVTARKSPYVLKTEFYDARDKEGFDTTMGYLLHLVGAQVVGDITYKPELVPAPRHPLRINGA
ncbi:MAG TPA: hypothetical protein VLG11_01880 [Candidatus Saccharimonadales bacterium]|nr:hypothetical protein [Candidatus Saccharimonadales bacterium]